MLDLFKNTQNSPFPWFNVVPILENLCQGVVTRNKQANLQLTLNKNLKNFEEDFLKTQKQIFENVAYR